MASATRIAIYRYTGSGMDADLSLPSCWVGTTSFQCHHRFLFSYAHYQSASQAHFWRKHMHLIPLLCWLIALGCLWVRGFLIVTTRHDIDVDFPFPFLFVQRSGVNW